ncbi:MAG: ribose 5-phosphate isomerase B [Angelakisella sp.]|nr:ribose 5-phosphate isomerase B [Angelakisella sp.]
MSKECEPTEKIIIACDHGGFRLKGFIIEYLKNQEIPYTDIGCYSEDIVRYPNYASEVAQRILSGEFTRGILICSTGVGMSIAANRYPGIRASLVSDHYTAMMTRQHNNSNVLCLGGKVIGEFQAIDILDAWLSNQYSGGRHEISLGLIHDLEKRLLVKEDTSNAVVGKR